MLKERDFIVRLQGETLRHNPAVYVHTVKAYTFAEALEKMLRIWNLAFSGRPSWCRVSSVEWHGRRLEVVTWKVGAV
jgi:hypothetical protein